jgi:isoprenylcysteine carboxyl methyltransferase (ICMT) family protein YpbQ
MIALAAELTLHQSVKYVAGAYAVFLAVVLIYVVIMSTRLRHNSRELAELRRELLSQADAAERERESAPVA